MRRLSIHLMTTATRTPKKVTIEVTFFDFLDEDENDGDNKFTGREDYSSSDGDDLSGEEEE